jgi:cell division protease FtsH
LSRFFKSAAFPILLVILLAFFVQNLFYGSRSAEQLTFTKFQAAVTQRNVSNVTLKTKDLVVGGKLTSTGQTFQVGFTQAYNMEQYLLDNGVEFSTDIQKSSIWMTLLGTLAPILLMIVFFIFLMNQMQGGGSKVMSFGKSRAKRMAIDQPKITFKDVAGVDEAVEELDEIKEFLENPKRFQSLGARIPKG